MCVNWSGGGVWFRVPREHRRGVWEPLLGAQMIPGILTPGTFDPEPRTHNSQVFSLGPASWYWRSTLTGTLLVIS